MTKFIELAKANVETAGTLAERPNFDDTVAELLMRNAAVITDRLKANEFWKLPVSVGSKALEAADVAITLAPLSPEDVIGLPHETEADRLYRVAVWQPLHSLQSRLASRAYSREIDTDVDKLKHAVALGSTAFAAILMASEENPTIVETERYFWGNTDAAVGRIQRAAAE